MTTGMGVDSAGNIYVASSAGASVSVFAHGLTWVTADGSVYQASVVGGASDVESGANGPTTTEVLRAGDGGQPIVALFFIECATRSCHRHGPVRSGGEHRPRDRAGIPRPVAASSACRSPRSVARNLPATCRRRMAAKDAPRDVSLVRHRWGMRWVHAGATAIRTRQDRRHLLWQAPRQTRWAQFP